MNKPILAVYGAHRSVQQVSDTILNQLDILYYAFGVIKNAEIHFTYPEDIATLHSIRERHPDLKIVLSVGGGGCGDEVTQSLQIPGGFEKTIDSMVSAVIENGFDGIDLDWEFPTVSGHPEERMQHHEMLRGLRERLDATGRHYLVTVAVPSGEWAFRITALEQSHVYLDYVNIMTYDMTNHRYTSHHTAPYDTSVSVDHAGGSAYNSICVFKNHGVPGEKILIGGAFYSKKWTNITGVSDGLASPVGQPCQYGPGIMDILENYVDQQGFKRFWDDSAKAPYLYDGNTFLTYDDMTSLKYKCEMVLNEHIAGIMAWELSGDRCQEILPFMRSELSHRAG